MKTYIINAIVALLLIIGVNVATPSQQSDGLKGLSERDVQTVSLTVGTNPTTARPATKATKYLFGTCNAATTQLPLEATSTDNFTCSASGARSGDNVDVILPSDSGSFLGGFTISYATVSASDTITFGIVNLTGSATSSFPLATTSVMYRVWDN